MLPLSFILFIFVAVAVAAFRLRSVKQARRRGRREEGKKLLVYLKTKIAHARLARTIVQMRAVLVLST